MYRVSLKHVSSIERLGLAESRVCKSCYYSHNHIRCRQSAKSPTKEPLMSDSTPVSPLELHHKIYGTGNPVLCIHGFGASLFSWRNFVGPLSRNYQLILIDLKGCGESPKPPGSRYSPQDHADLIYKFILDHDLKNLTLVGNSFGGSLSLLLSIRLIENEP